MEDLPPPPTLVLVVVAPPHTHTFPNLAQGEAALPAEQVSQNNPVFWVTKWQTPSLFDIFSPFVLCWESALGQDTGGFSQYAS